MKCSNSLEVGGVLFSFHPESKNTPMDIRPVKMFAGEDMPERHLTKEDCRELLLWLHEKVNTPDAQEEANECLAREISRFPRSMSEVRA